MTINESPGSEAVDGHARGGNSRAMSAIALARAGQLKGRRPAESPS